MDLAIGRAWILAVVVALWLTALVNGQSSPTPYLRFPSPRQVQWHRNEYYAFIHFGPNTFTDEEWGRSQSTPDVFNPTALDTDQWAKTFADAGMAGMILTAKHHDGMALWNTSTTTYKIGNGKWAKERAAEGLDADVVRLAAASAKKYNIKFGIYLSPWDIHRDPAMPKKNLTGTPYDEPQIFGDSSSGDYNDLYASQLTELVTLKLADESPIQIFELWLDGASGSDTVQTFNWTRFRDIIREHQPEAIMWGHQGVDARWVGNEDGVTVATNWHTISRTQDQPRYSEAQLQTGERDGKYWTPAEADARLRTGWFYHRSETSKTAEALLEMYLKSVGQSVNLNLDVPPDTTGQIPTTDASVLLKFKALRDAFLNRNILTPDMQVSASSTLNSVSNNSSTSLYSPSNILTTDPTTYWHASPNDTTGYLQIDLGSPHIIDAVILQEHIPLGQRIGGYQVDCLSGSTGPGGGVWRRLVDGTSMGYKRIHRFGGKDGVETEMVMLRFTQGNKESVVQSLQVLGRRKDG